MRVSASGVRLSHRFGRTDTIDLSPSALRVGRQPTPAPTPTLSPSPTPTPAPAPAPAPNQVDLSDAASLRLMRSTDAVAADGIRCVCDTQQRDLLVLVARALSAVQSEATQEGACQVWEGEGYVDYYGRLHGQVIPNPSPDPDPDPNPNPNPNPDPDPNPNTGR